MPNLLFPDDNQYVQQQNLLDDRCFSVPTSFNANQQYHGENTGLIDVYEAPSTLVGGAPYWGTGPVGDDEYVQEDMHSPVPGLHNSHYTSPARTVPVGSQLDTTPLGANEGHLQGNNLDLPIDTYNTRSPSSLGLYSQPPTSESILPSIEPFDSFISPNTIHGHHNYLPASGTQVSNGTNVPHQIERPTDDSNSRSGSTTGLRSTVSPAEATERKRRPSRRAAASIRDKESVQESGNGWLHKKDSESQWRKSNLYI